MKMGEDINFQNCWVAIAHEHETFRNNDTKLTSAQIVDLGYRVDNFDLPNPEKKYEENRPIGGTRTVGKISDLGFDNGEQSPPLKMLDGKFLYWMLGACITTGTYSIQSATGTVTGTPTTTITGFTGLTIDAEIGNHLVITSGTASGHRATITDNDATTVTIATAITGLTAGDTMVIYEPLGDTVDGTPTSSVITLTTGGLTIDAHIGQMLRDVTTGRNFMITDNDATTITVNETIETGDIVSGDTIEIYQEPFDHNISLSSTVKSFALHTQQDSDYNDLLGCFLKSLEIVAESDAEVMITPEISSAKKIAGDSLTKPTQICNRIYVFSDVTKESTNYTLSYVKYNSTDIDSTQWANATSATINITTDSEVRKTFDKNPDKLVSGPIDYKLTLRVYPQDDASPSYKDIYNYDLPYTNTLNALIEFSCNKAANDKFIRFTWSDLYIESYPDKLVNADDIALDVEVGLTNNTDGTLTVLVRDDKGSDHYESKTIST